MGSQFDLAVMGSGPGGYVAAIYAAKLGLKVVLIEERELGGTCLNRGCIPTKSLLHSAELYHSALHSNESGIIINGVKYDYEKIVLRKDRVVKQLRTGVEQLVKGNGCTILHGRAVIKDRNTIEVIGKDRREISCDKIIIATGSRPSKPPIPGIDGQKVFDSDGVLGWTCLPDRIVIIGGGVIGMELASIFNFLDKEVAIVEMAEQIIPGIDTEISLLLHKTMESKGIKIYTGARVTSIKSGANAVCSFEKDGKAIEIMGDAVVVAVGRKANIENIGLEALDIELQKGFIKVGDGMGTSVKGIYAIGDVNGKALLAHVASAQGIVAAAYAAGEERKMNNSIIPGCIYSNPEIAVVGLTEAEALKNGYEIKVGRFPVNANGKSMIMDEKNGIIKIITDIQTGEILGAHIMAPRATDMISELCVAMKLESTVEEIADTIHPHPTVSEIIMEAAHDVEGRCIHKLLIKKN